jgi:hypothetical protein
MKFSDVTVYRSTFNHTRIAVFFVLLAIFSPGSGADTIYFSTLVGALVDARVVLRDGRGAAEIPGMVAQLFLVQGEMLTALGDATGFITDRPDIANSTSYVRPEEVPIEVEDHCGLTTIRMRVWESTKGATFEEARDKGGYFGESETQIRISGQAGNRFLTGLPGFTLERTEAGTAPKETIHRGPTPMAEQAGGQIVFANKVGTSVNAPVFLPDGSGVGQIPRMVAQMFLIQGDNLVPLKPASTFRNLPTNPIAAAYFYPQTVDVPMATDCTATLRLRVWEETKGATYEEAEANGGYFGESETTIKLGGGTEPPANLMGLPGFTVRRNSRLAVDRASAQAGLLLQLEVDPADTYAIESSADLVMWRELQRVQTSGMHGISLPPSGAQLFFRAVRKE